MNLDDAQAEVLLRYYMGELLDMENVQVEHLEAIASVVSADLQTVFQQHAETTREQLATLTTAFGDGVLPILAPINRAFSDDFQQFHGSRGTGALNQPTLDMYSLITAQKMEQIEIICYTIMSRLATQIGRTDLTTIFDTILAEEQQALAQLQSLTDPAPAPAPA